MTQLLTAIDDGDKAARSKLWELIYHELRAIAHHQLRGVADCRTLQPTALVHEAWLKLVGPEQGWSNRAHFFGAVAQVMREILVDDARRRSRAKRGGDQPRRRIDILNLHVPATDRDPLEVLAIDESIERLRRLSARQADVMVCRYFAGMTIPETSEALGVSLRTIQSDSSLAAAWLRRELGTRDDQD